MVKSFRAIRFALVGVSLFAARSVEAGVIESFEGPGVTSSTVPNVEIVDFNSLSTGYKSSEEFVLPNLTVTYTGDFFILQADKFGGAPDSGDLSKDTNYLGVKSGNQVTMTLSTPQAYFGLWFSAADKLNDLAFYSGNRLIASITGTGPVLGALTAAYKGNPTQQFNGQDSSENFVFINFTAQTNADKFDRIVLSNANGGTIFESDNHTFAAEIPDTIPGTSVVAEPSSVALLGVGAACVAAAAYRRRRHSAPAVPTV